MFALPLGIPNLRTSCEIVCCFGVPPISFRRSDTSASFALLVRRAEIAFDRFGTMTACSIVITVFMGIDWPYSRVKRMQTASIRPVFVAIGLSLLYTVLFVQHY